MSIDVVYANGRAKGRAVTPGASGMKEIAVDTFQAYPRSVTGLAVPVIFHVSADDPRRVVKVTPTGSPMLFELAR